MKIFITYLLTAIISYWMVMFFFGVSAGFANYSPILSVLGSVLLFSVVSPVLVFNSRLGLYGGIIASLLMLPQGFMFVLGALDDNVFNWGVILVSLPFLLIVFNLFFTLNKVVKKDYSLKGIPVNNSFKMILSGIPIMLFIVYLISIWEYLSLGMFKI